jgi:ABC-type lipoprotein release transport system permease subunit
VGVPAGTVIGRVVWQAFAGYLGVLPAPVVAAQDIGGVALGAVLVATVLGMAPALVISRSRPANVLRAS